MKTATLGVIVGNRGFFPDHLADEGPPFESGPRYTFDGKVVR